MGEVPVPPSRIAAADAGAEPNTLPGAEYRSRPFFLDFLSLFVYNGNRIKKRTANDLKRFVSIVLSITILFLLLPGLLACNRDDPTEETTATVSDTAFTTAVITTAEPEPEIPVVYNGHDIIDGTYSVDGGTYDFRYSDGFFEVDPKAYQTHMATMSMSLSHAASKMAFHGDYSVCPDEIKSILSQIGFENVYVSSSYLVKPTVDSVACVFAEKTVESARGTTTVISVVLRSGGFLTEWASNFRLGLSGEAEGIAAAADKVCEEYLAEFLSDNPHLTAALAEGKVAFWVQGYSRGGAVANLTAKRLVDRYQAAGNDVYAYSINEQKSGVAEAEDPERDYTVIHSVIDPADPVPYLAPAEMGFKRYGLDHYLFSGKADSANPIPDENGNPVSDNKRLVTMPEKRLSLMRKQLVAMLGNEFSADPYMPYAIQHVGFNLVTRELVPLDRTTKTATFLQNFINGFSKIPDGDVLTDRAAYVESGVEDVLERLMLFLYSGVDLDAFGDTDLLSGIASDVAEECKDAIAESTYWNQYGKLTLNLHGRLAREATDAFVTRLREVDSFRDLLAGYPEGGFDRAIEDLSIFLYSILNSVTDLDDLVTAFYNGSLVTVNHEYLPNLALLRSYDSWFEPTAGE